jgi:glycosyltransferase involved in cell wall biosynthesis
VPFVTQFENAMGVLTSRCPLPTRAVRKLLALYAGTTDVDYEFGTLLRDSDRVIVLGARHEARLTRLYPPTARKSVLIPPPPIVRIFQATNGSARDTGRDLLRIKSDEFVLTYFGYLYPSKGIETLLQAFHLVRSRGRRAATSTVVGSLIGGRYRVRRLCGEGGMGRVYLARQGDLAGRLVAVLVAPMLLVVLADLRVRLRGWTRPVPEPVMSLDD